MKGRIRYLRSFLYDIRSNIRDVWGISDIMSKIDEGKDDEMITLKSKREIESMNQSGVSWLRFMSGYVILLNQV